MAGRGRQTPRGILAALLSSVLLAGCGSLNPLDWLGGAEDLEPPAELTELTPTLAVSERWRADSGEGSGDEVLALALGHLDDRLFSAARDGRVTAFSLEGAKLWERHLDLPLSGGPGAGEGLVLVGSSEAWVIALDAGEGEERWRTRVSAEVLSTPAVGDGVVVVHTSDGRVFGLDAADGSRRWVFDRPEPALTLRGSSSPVIVDGNCLVGLAHGRLVNLAVATGDVQWEAEITPPAGRSELDRVNDVDADPVVYEGQVYAMAYQGHLAAVDLDSGEVLWRRELSGYAGLARDWHQLYVTAADSQVWAIDPEDGATMWRQDKLLNRRLSGPAVQGEALLVGDFEGWVHWLSLEDGHLLARARVSDAPIRATPLVLDDVAYVFAADGTLAAFAEDGARGEDEEDE